MMELHVLLVVSCGLGVIATVLGSRCERITAPMCQQLGYNTTLMPNILGHEQQDEAVEGLQQYDVLLDHNCSPFLRLFVCSAFVPLCSEDTTDAVPPCRELCENVKRDCLSVFQSNGLAWPAEFECLDFPEPPSLCIQPPDNDSRGPENEDATPLEHFYSLKSRTPHCQSGKAFNGKKCVNLCYTHDEEPQVKRDHALYDITTAVWSIICLIVTSFALLTFIIQPKRFRWPARPVLYLTSCGFVASTVYLFKWIAGPLICSGATVLEKPTDSLTCVGAALLLVFCEIAFVLWWCVFCLVWFLSAAKEWSTEAIEKISTRLHAAVWTVTTCSIIYCLLSNNIEANEFTGLCEVQNHILVIVKLGFAVLGSVLAVLTSVALKNVRRALVYLYAGRSPFKLERLIYRVGVTSLGICVPLFICLLCNFFDTLTAMIVQVTMRLLSAIFAALWVFSSKTFKNWNKILRPGVTNKGLREIPVTKV